MLDDNAYALRMAIYVALLRAVNVGGTGKLAMSELVSLCEAAGFARVKTYIQSGNVVFESKLSAVKSQAKLQTALAQGMGKPVEVLLRTRAELDAIVERNPFKEAAPNQLLVLFLNVAPEKAALAGLTIPGREQVRLDGREVFIHFPDGMGKSKLKLPFASTATGRNLNTVRKLAAMAKELEEA